MDLLQDETIDLIATHPPYANIISYSSKKNRVPGDLSFGLCMTEYLEGMEEIARESYRVLKPERFCALLVGDTRKHRHHVPVAFRVMQGFLNAGFILKEDVMKYQWKTKRTREKWVGLSKLANENWVDSKPKRYFTDFLLLSYEHLFVFRKPSKNEKLKDMRCSISNRLS